MLSRAFSMRVHTAASECIATNGEMPSRFRGKSDVHLWPSFILMR